MMSEEEQQEKDLELPEFDPQSEAPDQQAEDDASAASEDAAAPEDDVKTAVDLEPVFDVPVNISAVLGKTSLDVASLLKLQSGSILELDRRVGEAIDIYVNNRLVARGEVVVVDDRLGVTMTEIIKVDRSS